MLAVDAHGGLSPPSTAASAVPLWRFLTFTLQWAAVSQAHFFLPYPGRSHARGCQPRNLDGRVVSDAVRGDSDVVLPLEQIDGKAVRLVLRELQPLGAVAHIRHLDDLPRLGLRSLPLDHLIEIGPLLSGRHALAFPCKIHHLRIGVGFAALPGAEVGARLANGRRRSEETAPSRPPSLSGRRSRLGRCPPAAVPRRPLPRQMMPSPAPTLSYRW